MVVARKLDCRTIAMQCDAMRCREELVRRTVLCWDSYDSSGFPGDDVGDENEEWQFGGKGPNNKKSTLRSRWKKGCHGPADSAAELDSNFTRPSSFQCGT